MRHRILTRGCAASATLQAMVAHDPRSESRTVRLEDFEIHLSEGFVMAGGEVLTLSVREFQLLVAMVGRAGEIVRRDELCQADARWLR